MSRAVYSHVSAANARHAEAWRNIEKKSVVNLGKEAGEREMHPSDENEAMRRSVIIIRDEMETRWKNEQIKKSNHAKVGHVFKIPSTSGTSTAVLQFRFHFEQKLKIFGEILAKDRSKETSRQSLV